MDGEIFFSFRLFQCRDFDDRRVYFNEFVKSLAHIPKCENSGMSFGQKWFSRRHCIIRGFENNSSLNNHSKMGGVFWVKKIKKQKIQQKIDFIFELLCLPHIFLQADYKTYHRQHLQQDDFTNHSFSDSKASSSSSRSVRHMTNDKKTVEVRNILLYCIWIS